MNTIIVAISAGVATIYSVPRGVEVVIADFDIESCEQDLLDDSPFGDGKKCLLSRFVHNHHGKEAVELL